jgi:hypothetical protein
MAALPLFAACDAGEQSADSQKQGFAADIAQIAQKTPPATKKTFQDTVDAELEKIGAEVDQVQAMLLEINSDVDQQTKQSIIEFNESVEAFARQYQQLRSSAEADWQNGRRSTERLLADTREALLIMRTQVESALRLSKGTQGEAINQS